MNACILYAAKTYQSNRGYQTVRVGDRGVVYIRAVAYQNSGKSLSALLDLAKPKRGEVVLNTVEYCQL